MKKLMKNAAITMFLIMATAIIAQTVLRGKTVSGYPFYVYHDYMNIGNHYIPSGYMGDFGDINVRDNIRKNPQSGSTCLRIKYSANCTQGQQWAGIFWQNPANNWGTKKGGYDLSKAKRCTFWARGRNGGETVEFKIGGIKGKYSDTGSETTGKVRLTTSWKKYTINMDDMLATYVSGGFCVVFTKAANPKGFTIYLDEIRYE